MSTYVSTQVEGSSSSRDWCSPLRERLIRARANDGFSLLELVVAVSIILILAVVGFISYQGLTDNAREAAVESAAQSTYTAALAAFHEPGGASGLNARLMKVQEEYNESADGIRVDIYAGHAGGAEAGADVCVVAQNEQHEQFVAYRGDCDGVDVPNNGGTPGNDSEQNTDPIMVSTWNVDAGQTVDLPIFGFDGNVDWGDGVVNSDTNHTYNTAGEKTITINGTFYRWGDENVSLDGMESVDEWGDTETDWLVHAFSESDIKHVEELPVGVEKMTSAFENTEFNGDVSGWDTSSVHDMHRVFAFNTAFNQDVSSWDVSNVKYMDYMFYGATAFNGDVSGWEVSNVSNMYGMLSGASSFDQNLSSWDVSNVQDMDYMLFGATSFNNGGAPFKPWMTAAGAPMP